MYAYPVIKTLLPFVKLIAMNLATGIVYKDSWIANTVSEYDQFCNQQQHEGKQELIFKYISILLFHSYTF